MHEERLPSTGPREGDGLKPAAVAILSERCMQELGERRLVLGRRGAKLPLNDRQTVAHEPLDGGIGEHDLQLPVDDESAAIEMGQRVCEGALNSPRGGEMGGDEEGTRGVLAEQIEGIEMVPVEMAALKRALHAEGDDEVRQRHDKLRCEGADAVRAKKLLA